MATINPTVTRIASAVLFSWTFTEADTCAPASVPDSAADASLQLEGTFGGATVVLQGSNSGVAYTGLNDPGGTAISKLAAALTGVRERAQFMKPVATGGTGQSVTATLLVRRAR